eukprot:TRINITY_DN12180_c0_g1_i1.p1 TRINITY_DN12180_c0_g1~~TRINITY_DN12180_c0_g1_i1.p1  ORF type:complete len:253 (+),score=56.29 TRINITY_DN12180_c0_g1_i1:55-813(+)
MMYDVAVSELGVSLNEKYNFNLKSLEMLWEASADENTEDVSIVPEWDSDVILQRKWPVNAGINMCDLEWSPFAADEVECIMTTMQQTPLLPDPVLMIGIQTELRYSESPVYVTPIFCVGSHKLVYDLADDISMVLTLMDDNLVYPLPKHVKNHVHMKVADSETAILPTILVDIIRFATIAHKENTKAYIHCVAGVNRTMLVMCAILMVCHRLPLHMAVQYVRAKCNYTILLNKTFRRELATLEKILNEHTCS